jgi:hypothetical protein
MKLYFYHILSMKEKKKICRTKSQNNFWNFFIMSSPEVIHMNKGPFLSTGCVYSIIFFCFRTKTVSICKVCTRVSILWRLKILYVKNSKILQNFKKFFFETSTVNQTYAINLCIFLSSNFTNLLARTRVQRQCCPGIHKNHIDYWVNLCFENSSSC